jgi:hypothetical protein
VSLSHIQETLNNDISSSDARRFISDGHRGFEIVDTIVLPEINQFLLRPQRATAGAFGAKVLRAVGSIDLVFANRMFRSKCVFSRVHPTMLVSMGMDTSWKGW